MDTNQDKADINKIKEDLLDWLKNNSTKNLYSYFRNKQEDLQQIQEQVSKNYGFIPTFLSELCYLFLEKTEPNTIFCKKGKKKNFISFNLGYRPFCGSGKNCECINEYKSMKTKLAFNLFSEEKKTEIKNKRISTNLKKYKVINQGQREEVKQKQKLFYQKEENIKKTNEKIKNTILQKYGSIENYNKIRNEKSKATFIKKYGKDNPQKVEEIKQKTKNTNLIKYGFVNPSFCEEIKQKIKNSFKQKYGVNHPLQLQKFQEKSKRSCLEKYGTFHPMKSEKIKNKTKETWIRNYGVSHPMKKEEIKEKLKETFFLRYGVKWIFESDFIKNKIKNTNFLKYGKNTPFESSIIKDKIKTIFKEKYGVPWISYKHLSLDTIIKINDPEWLRYQHHVLKKSGLEIGKEIGVSESLICKKLNKFNIPILTITRSQHEKEVEKYLRDLGFEIKTNKRNIITPYELDIFVVDKNIAIEYCGLYWHNEENKGKRYHLDKLERCLEKGINLITLFESEWILDQENTKKKLKWILNGEENRLYENEIGKEKIFVDRRWGEGEVLLNHGYKLVEKLEPKKWAFIGQNLLEEWSLDMKDEIDFIWDCGWLVYEKR